MERGQFIAIYGINGIGKTTQVERLVLYLQSLGKDVFRLKYPIYDREPEGPFINRYLRDEVFRRKNILTTDELQKKYAENRRSYESILKKRIESGEWIVAEDYIGTGISWGLTRGSDLTYLEKINQDLLVPDVSILMHGNRHGTSIEDGHVNEQDIERIMICKNFLFLLSKRYGWHIVDANSPIDHVHKRLVYCIQDLLK